MEAINNEIRIIPYCDETGVCEYVNGICVYCREECEHDRSDLEYIDDSIGDYEFWGARGVHKASHVECNACGEDVTEIIENRYDI